MQVSTFVVILIGLIGPIAADSQLELVRIDNGGPIYANGRYCIHASGEQGDGRKPVDVVPCGSGSTWFVMINYPNANNVYSGLHQIWWLTE